MDEWTTNSWGDDWDDATPVAKPVTKPAVKPNRRQKEATAADSSKQDVSSEPTSANSTWDNIGWDNDNWDEAPSQPPVKTKAAASPKAVSTSSKKQAARAPRGRKATGGAADVAPVSEPRTASPTEQKRVPVPEAKERNPQTRRKESVQDAKPSEEQAAAERELDELAKQEQQRAEAEAEMLRIAREENAERLRQEELLVAEQKRKEEEEQKAEQQRKAEEKRKEEERRIEAERAERARLAEDARKSEEARLAEEVRKAEEARKAEKTRKREELERAEELRKAQEKIKVEEARKAVEAKKVEDKLKADETRRKEEAKRAEESRLHEERRADEARKAEEKRLAEEARLQKEKLAEEKRQREVRDEVRRQQELKRVEEEKAADALRRQEEEIFLRSLKEQEPVRETFEATEVYSTEYKPAFPIFLDQFVKDHDMVHKENTAAGVMRQEQSRLMAEDGEQRRLDDILDNAEEGENLKNVYQDYTATESRMEANQLRMYQEIENDLREEHEMFSKSHEKLRQAQQEDEHYTEQPDEENAPLIEQEQVGNDHLTTEPDVKQVSATAAEAEWGWGDDADWNDNSTMDTVESSDTTIQSPRSVGGSAQPGLAEKIAMSVTSPDVFGSTEPFSTESASSTDPRSSTFIEPANPNHLAPSSSTGRSRGSSRFSGLSLSPLQSEQSFRDGQLGVSSGSRGTDGRESISSVDHHESYDEEEDGESSAQSYENGERHRLRDRYDSRTTDTDDDERRDGNRHNGTYSPSVTDTSFSSHQEDDVESVRSAETIDSAGTNWTVTNPIEQIMRAFGGMPPPPHAFAQPFPSQYSHYPFPTSSSVQPPSFFATAPPVVAPVVVSNAPTSQYMRKYLYPHAAGDFVLEKAVAVNNLEKPIPVEMVRVHQPTRLSYSDVAKFPHDLASGAVSLDDRISVYCKAMSEAAFEFGSLDQSKREEGLMWNLLSLLVRHGTNVRNYAIAETLMAGSRERSLMGSSTSLMSMNFSSESYPGEKKLSGVRRCLAAGLIPRACKAAEEQGRTPLAFMLLSLPSVIKTNNTSALGGFMRYVERTISPADPIYTACALMCGHTPKLNDCAKNWTMHAALTIGCGSLIPTTSKNRFLLNLAGLFDGLGKPMVRDILYLLARPVPRIREPDRKLIGSNVFANHVEQSTESSAKIVERLLLTELFVFVTNKINPGSHTNFVALPQLIYIEQLLSRGNHAEAADYLAYVYRNATSVESSTISSVFWITFYTLVVTNQDSLEKHDEMYISITERIRQILDEQRVHLLARQAEEELRLMEQARQMKQQRLVNEQLRLEEQARQRQNQTEYTSEPHHEDAETFSHTEDVPFSAHVDAHRDSPSLSHSRTSSHRASPHSVGNFDSQTKHSTSAFANLNPALDHFPPPVGATFAPVPQPIPTTTANTEDRITTAPSEQEDLHSLQRHSRAPSVQNEAPVNNFILTQETNQGAKALERLDTAYDEEGGWEEDEHLDFFRLPTKKKSAESEDERDYSSYGTHQESVGSADTRHEHSYDSSYSYPVIPEHKNNPETVWNSSAVPMFPSAAQTIGSADTVADAEKSEDQLPENPQQDNQGGMTYRPDSSANYYHLDYSYNAHQQEYPQSTEESPGSLPSLPSEIAATTTNPADQSAWNIQPGTIGTDTNQTSLENYQQEQPQQQYYQDGQSQAAQYQQWSDQQQGYYTQYPNYDFSQAQQVPYTATAPASDESTKPPGDAVAVQQQMWSTDPTVSQNYATDNSGNYAQQHTNSQYSAAQPQWNQAGQYEQSYPYQPETAPNPASNQSWNSNQYYQTQVPAQPQSTEPEVPLEEDEPVASNLTAQYGHPQQTYPGYGFQSEQFPSQPVPQQNAYVQPQTQSQTQLQPQQPQQPIPPAVPAESSSKPGLMGRFTGLFKSKPSDTASQSASVTSFNSGPAAPPLYNFNATAQPGAMGAMNNMQFSGANPATAQHGIAAQPWAHQPEMYPPQSNGQFPPGQAGNGAAAYSSAQAPQLNAQVYPGQTIPALY